MASINYGTFSLSPAVKTFEIDQSGYTANPQSSLTGFVIAAENGPSNKLLAMTNESDMTTAFGIPTTYNYLDWYNCWNFLQYAQTAYAVRPMNTSVKNAGVALTGSYPNGYTQNDTPEENLYNSTVAEITLQDMLVSDKLTFFNRYVTPTQSLGLSVCSTSTYWNSPIANEFFATATIDATKDANLNNIGGAFLASGEITLTGSNTLKIGSQFNGNGKLFTVLNVVSTGTPNIVVNGPVVAGDISDYYGTVKTLTTVDFSDPTVDVVFDGTKRFSLNLYNVFSFNDTNVVNGTDCGLYYVSDIVYPVSVGGDYTVTFTKALLIGASTTATLSAAQEIYSNSDYYFFTPSDDYLVGDYNPVVSGSQAGYSIPAGTTTIKVKSGFNYPVGTEIKFISDGTFFVDNSPDTLPGLVVGGTYNYEIISIDRSNNTITLDDGLAQPLGIATGDSITDIVTHSTILRGINLYSTVFDNSIISTTPTRYIDAATLLEVSVNAESLIKFNELFEYVPNWLNGEFVTVICKKNASGLFGIVETQLASYNPKARDYANNNEFADEVFFYGSNYMYVKTSADQELDLVDTANLPLIQLVSSGGTVVNSANVFGTVYPVYLDNNGLIDLTKDIVNVPPQGVYNPNGYTLGDFQNAETAFSDAESFNVDLLVAPSLDLNGMSQIAETRHDCLAIVAPYDYRALVGKSNTQATQYMIDKFGTTSTDPSMLFDTFGTYTKLVANMKYQYDKFNDVNRWMCLAGDIAGLYAQTDANFDPWWAADGLTRGKVLNVIKLAFNPNKTNRDALYVNALNAVINIAGEGAGISWGNKTATAIPSALDRVNVRRLMITIERAVAIAVKVGLFEFNDTFTRARLVGIVDPYLRSVQARRGVVGYKIQCDSLNNTPEVIAQNGLVMNVSVQPNRVAEFINVYFDILGTSTTITETVSNNQ